MQRAEIKKLEMVERIQNSTLVHHFYIITNPTWRRAAILKIVMSPHLGDVVVFYSVDPATFVLD